MENWQYEQRKSLPLNIKIQLSKKKIREFYERFNGDVYVAVDGKDSNVLAHLVRSIYPDVVIMHINTGVGFPENLEQLKTQWDNIVLTRPKISFIKVIKKYGVPIFTKQQAHYIYQCQTGKSEKHKKRLLTGIMPNGKKTQFKISKKYLWAVDSNIKISDICCDKLKKEPIKRFEKESGLKPFIGTMATESSQRKFKYLKEGCNVFEGTHIHSTPVAFWTEQDILQYHLDNPDLKLSKAYGEIVKCGTKSALLTDVHPQLDVTGYKRTGCIGCPFGAQYEKENKRYLMMKETHPKQHNIYINHYGFGAIFDECAKHGIIIEY